MFDFHEKRKIRRILYSKTVFVLLILITIFLSVSVYNRYTVARETKEKLEERRQDLEALEVRVGTLDEKVNYLENERGIEEELRNRFDVAKEGEQVVIILEDKEKSPKVEPLTKESADVSENGFFSFIKLFKFW